MPVRLAPSKPTTITRRARFRSADFPNPEHLLRGGETGTVLIHRVLSDALVIPRRATFEMAGRRYVFVVDKNDVAHRREIVIRNQLKDLLVIRTGLVQMTESSSTVFNRFATGAK